MQRARGERDARAGGSAADASPRYKATLARVSGQLTESLRFSRGARQPMVRACVDAALLSCTQL